MRAVGADFDEAEFSIDAAVEREAVFEDGEVGARAVADRILEGDGDRAAVAEADDVRVRVEEIAIRRAEGIVAAAVAGSAGARVGDVLRSAHERRDTGG